MLPRRLGQTPILVVSSDLHGNREPPLYARHMTAGFYDNDDAFREYWKNTEAMKNFQKMIDDTMAPALEAIRQSAAITDAQKRIAEAIRPAIDASTLQAVRAIATSMPAIQLPNIPRLDFGNIGQLKLGDAVARQFAASLDLTEMKKSASQPTDEAPATVPELDPSSITEEELDQYVDIAFRTHPDLAERLESDPELTALNDYQKKMMCWLLGIMVTFGLVLLHTWGTVDENVGKATDAIEKVGAGYAAYKYVAKPERKRDEDPESDPEDDPDTTPRS